MNSDLSDPVNGVTALKHIRQQVLSVKGEANSYNACTHLTVVLKKLGPIL